MTRPCDHILIWDGLLMFVPASQPKKKRLSKLSEPWLQHVRPLSGPDSSRLNLNKPDPCEYHLGPKSNYHDYSYNTNTVHFHSLCIEHSKQFHLVAQLQYRCCKYQHSPYPTDYQTVPRNCRVARNRVCWPDCSFPERRTGLIGANFVIS